MGRIILTNNGEKHVLKTLMLSLAAVLQKGQNPAVSTVCRSNIKKQDTMNGYSPAARQKRVTVIKRGAILTDIFHWANLKRKNRT